MSWYRFVIAALLVSYSMAANECNPSKGCNVCQACCQSYIPDGAPCDQCVTQQCPKPAITCKTTGSTGASYDFTPLMGTTYSWLGMDGPANGFANFTTQICGNVPCRDEDSDAAVCQNDRHVFELYNCGNLHGATFQSVNRVEDGICVSLTYPNGETEACPNGMSRSTVIYLQCNESETGNLYRTYEDSNSPCVYQMYFATKYACPCQAKPKPSPTPPSPPPIYTKPYIRVGHSIPTDNNVDIVISQGSVSHDWNNLAFRQFSDWNTLFEIGNGNVTVYQNNGGSRGKLLLTVSRFLTPGPLMIVTKDYWPPTEDYNIEAIASSYVPPIAGESAVRLVNLMPGSPAIDLLRNAQPVWTNIKYQVASDHRDVVADKATYQIVPDKQPNVVYAQFDTSPPVSWGAWMLGIVNSTQYPPQATVLTDSPEAWRLFRK